jgi:uncharacterized protein with PIN domain
MVWRRQIVALSRQSSSRRPAGAIPLLFKGNDFSRTDILVAV